MKKYSDGGVLPKPKTIPDFLPGAKVLTSSLDLGYVLRSEVENQKIEYTVGYGNYQEIFYGSELAICDWESDEKLGHFSQIFGDIARSQYYNQAFNFLLDNYFQLSRKVIILTNKNRSLRGVDIVKSNSIYRLRVHRKILALGLGLAVIGNIVQWLL